MGTKTLQEQIDIFYKETGYRLKIKDGKVYYDGCLDLYNTKVTELPDNLIVSGYINLNNTTITELPDNLVIGGNFYLYNTKIVKLPENLVVGGWLDLECSNITKLPDNLVVGGSLDLEDTKITKLPDNLAVGGSLYVSHTNIDKLPDNLVVGRDLDISHAKITKLPDNLVVGCDLDIRYTEIAEPLDNLAVGEKIFNVSKAPITPTLTKEAKEKIQKIRNFMQWNVGGKTYIRTDGILSVVDSHRGNVWVTHQIGKEEPLYVVTDGEHHYAHGSTLKEAKADLIYKINDRDTSLYENLSLDDELSFEDAVAMYRTITGACSAGTRDFVENKLPEPLKEKYAIREIIDLTDGEYGSEKLKEFFN